MKTFPYTTPSGHTYQAPTDYKSLVNRVMDWQQSIIEQWDEDESPPDPLAFREFAVFAWNQAVRMTEEVERLEIEKRRYQFAPMGDNHHNAKVCPYCNFNNDRPWPRDDAIALVHRWATHFLRDHDCDHQGYENLMAALEAIRPEPAS